MSDSTRIDINYISVTPGPTFTQDSGSEYAHQVPWPGPDLTVSDPKKYASILKVADGATFYAHDLIVPQGSEGAVDLNNKASAILQGDFGSRSGPWGQRIISVKGSSRLELTGTLYGEGTQLGADVLVDMWSDQDYGWSYVDLTKAKRTDGRKITVVKRYGASRVIGDVYVLTWASVKNTAYWWAKRTVRLFMGIKQGQKGPSWL